MSIHVFFATFLLCPVILSARRVRDGVVLQYDDALQRDNLAFETRLLNASSSSRSHSTTVEVLQNAASAAAATVAQLRHHHRDSKHKIAKSRRMDDVARSNLLGYQSRQDESKGVDDKTKTVTTSAPLTLSQNLPPSRTPGPGGGEKVRKGNDRSGNGKIQIAFFVDANDLFQWISFRRYKDDGGGARVVQRRDFLNEAATIVLRDHGHDAF